MASNSARTPNGGHLSKPKIKKLPASYYDQFLSINAKERKPSPIRGLFPLEKTPGVISLLAGKPNVSTFPFTSFSFTARDPLQSPSGPGTDENNGKEISVQIDSQALATGLQYGDTAGIPSLLRWLEGLQEKMHGRTVGEGEGWKICVGSGSQDLIYKAVAAMINPGDSILVESPVYAGVIPMFQSLHCDQIEIDTDAHGICSDSLRKILEEWPEGKRKPKVLYTVPYGCNPTGMTATIERRKDVLKLAREHDFIIFEDDPYYYLYYGSSSRPPSYFSLEATEPSNPSSDEAEVGRVLRFDSLSKILSAGMRIGWASGPDILLGAMERHTATSNLQTSSLTQVITYSLLSTWGYDTFLLHTEHVSQFYREKRDVFQKAMKKHMSGLAEWVQPEAGMFFWFKLCGNEENANDTDSKALIEGPAFTNGVLALPGTVFLPNGRKSPYVRASFSVPSEEEVEEALRRLGETIKNERSGQ
ncbi:PLP-dependent transferase [Dendrothele bispora CBS 962.96]|uniref:PLP-dependent transferase n=1 Tax=Dendrothele bispora (strain CBS 962.96) TaxID=1314807 RepID=A0A4V4HHY9_DENBC|nr:PLP-dependent transferase [Dendrothele bispora CBS 962.96]